MKKGRVLKEGLIQYRIACQAINVASLEDVIKHLLKLAHDRAEAAQAQATTSNAALQARRRPARPLLVPVAPLRNLVFLGTTAIRAWRGGVGPVHTHVTGGGCWSHRLRIWRRITRRRI